MKKLLGTILHLMLILFSALVVTIAVLAKKAHASEKTKDKQERIWVFKEVYRKPTLDDCPPNTSIFIAKSVSIYGPYQVHCRVELKRKGVLS